MEVCHYSKKNKEINYSFLIQTEYGLRFICSLFNISTMLLFNNIYLSVDELPLNSFDFFICIIICA